MVFHMDNDLNESQIDQSYEIQGPKLGTKWSEITFF